jgi:cysteine desulfurase
MKEMRDLLYLKLKNSLKEIHLNGHPTKSLPDILNVSFIGMTSEELFNKIREFIALTPDASYVLDAISLPEKWKKCAIRFSVGKKTTKEEITQAVSILVKILNKTT